MLRFLWLITGNFKPRIVPGEIGGYRRSIFDFSQASGRSDTLNGPISSHGSDSIALSARGGSQESLPAVSSVSGKFLFSPDHTRIISLLGWTTLAMGLPNLCQFQAVETHSGQGFHFTARWNPNILSRPIYHVHGRQVTSVEQVNRLLAAHAHQG